MRQFEVINKSSSIRSGRERCGRRVTMQSQLASDKVNTWRVLKYFRSKDFQMHYRSLLSKQLFYDWVSVSKLTLYARL